MTRRGVIFDLVAAQSPSYRGRGIARYSTDLVRAMVRYHPDMVNAVVVHPDLAPLDDLQDLGPWLTTEPAWQKASVIHLSSVFEPEVPVRQFWPREASANGLLVAATVYDLIPDLWPDVFMEDPGLRRRWRCCREVARTADGVLTLSESARADTVNMLGVPPERVHFIGAASSGHFGRTSDPKSAWKVVSRAIRGAKPGFVIYVGAINPRKNVDGLIKAYAALPRYLIDRHQLVVQCFARPLERNHYLVMAEQMGLRGRVLFPGYVPEEVLVAEYQCAALNIFPSLYEGYGLPVIEAMACGTPSIAGRNSSLVEILPDFALFDAADPAAISEAMARALEDEALRHRLYALTEHEPPTWEEVADRAATVFEGLMEQAEQHRPAWRARPQLALVGAPPELADALGRLAAVDLFKAPGAEGGDDEGVEGDGVEGVAHDGTGNEGRRAMAYATLARLDPWRGGYDAIVCWVADGHGTSAKAAAALAEEWPGRVVAVLAHPHQANRAQGAVGVGAGDRLWLAEAGVMVVLAVEGWAATADGALAAVKRSLTPVPAR